MAWATFQDVTDRWVGANVPTNEVLVGTIIADAESVILAQYPKIQDRITNGLLPLQTVVMVVCGMVERKLRNPGNLSQMQYATGPFSQSQSFGSGNGGLKLTSDEISLLAPKSRGKAFSVDLAPNITSWGLDSSNSTGLEVE